MIFLVTQKLTFLYVNSYVIKMLDDVLRKNISFVKREINPNLFKLLK